MLHTNYIFLSTLVNVNWFGIIFLENCRPTLKHTSREREKILWAVIKDISAMTAFHFNTNLTLINWHDVEMSPVFFPRDVLLILWKAFCDSIPVLIYKVNSIENSEQQTIEIRRHIFIGSVFCVRGFRLQGLSVFFFSSLMKKYTVFISHNIFLLSTEIDYINLSGSQRRVQLLCNVSNNKV